MAMVVLLHWLIFPGGFSFSKGKYTHLFQGDGKSKVELSKGPPQQQGVGLGPLGPRVDFF